MSSFGVTPQLPCEIERHSESRWNVTRDFSNRDWVCSLSKVFFLHTSTEYNVLRLGSLHSHKCYSKIERHVVDTMSQETFRTATDLAVGVHYVKTEKVGFRMPAIGVGVTPSLRMVHSNVTASMPCHKRLFEPRLASSPSGWNLESQVVRQSSVRQSLPGRTYRYMYMYVISGTMRNVLRYCYYCYISLFHCS